MSLDWLSLGGYARYVWPAVGVTLALVILEWLALARRHRSALREAAATEPGR
jgi:heme exporter protein CcmD